MWLAVVAPVNAAVAEALRADPESVPQVWMRLQSRWEYGHVAGFVVQLVGFAALLVGVLIETPSAGSPRATPGGPC
jgi:hypothetical protein